MRPSTVLVTLVVMCSPGSLPAQEPATDLTRISAFLGLGGGGFQSLDDAPNDPGIALLGGVAVQRRPHLFTLRGSLVAEVLADGVADVGILYGRAWGGGRTHQALSAGAALVFGEDCQGLFGGPCDSTTTVGLPLAATVSFRPARVLGIGLEAFANLNTLSSYAALALVLELGRLR